MLKLKLQYFGHLMGRTYSLEKTLMLGKTGVGELGSMATGDLGSIPGLGRSPGEGKGYPLQYSGLENSMDCSPPGSFVQGIFQARIWSSLPIKITKHTKVFLASKREPSYTVGGNAN